MAAWLGCSPAFAATQVFTGAVSGDIENPANYASGSAVPTNDTSTDELQIAAGAVNQPVLTKSRSLAKLTFLSASGGGMLSSGTPGTYFSLTLGSGGLDTSAATSGTTVFGDSTTILRFAMSSTFNVGTGSTLRLQGNLGLGGNPSGLTFSKNGSGTLELACSGALGESNISPNTFSVNTGTARVISGRGAVSGGSFGRGLVNLNIASGATYDLNGVSVSCGSLSGAGTLTDANNSTSATLTITQNSNTTFSGLITDAVATGDSTATGMLSLLVGATQLPYSLTLTNTNNAYRGTTGIGNNGTLIIGADGFGLGVLGQPSGPNIIVTLGAGSDSASSGQLLVGGAFTFSRPIVVNPNNSGTQVIGGATDNNATVSGSISVNRSQGLNINSVTTGTNTLTVSGIISGTGGLNINTPVSGAAPTGTVFVNGDNTFGGKTTVGAGTLRTGNLNNVVGGTASSNLGAPTSAANGTISLGSGANTATLSCAGVTTDRLLDLSGTTGGAIIDVSSINLNPLVFLSGVSASGAGAKTLTLQGTSTRANAIVGPISDSSGGATSVVKNSTGSWTLGGTNTYTGNTTINSLFASGTLTVTNSQGLGAGNSHPDNVLINAGATLNVNLDGSGSNGTILFGGPNTPYNITASGGGSSLPLNIGPNTSVNTNNSILFGTLTVPTTTTLNLTGSGGYKGVFFSLNVPASAGGSGASVTFNNNTDLTISRSVTQAITTAPQKLTFNGSGNTIVNGGISATGENGANVLGLTKNGSGTTLTLNGAGNYGGGVALVGTLNIGNASALGAGLFSINSNATFDNTSGATLTLSTNNPIKIGGSPTFTGTNDLNLGTGAVTLSGAATRTLSVANAGATLTLGGSIGQDAAGRNLVKAGAGTLLLAGDSSKGYSGNTTVSAGTLKIGNANALGTDAGTTLVSSGATLDLNGVNGVVPEVISDLNGTGVNGTGALINSVPNTLTVLSGGINLSSTSARGYSIGGAGNIDLALAANPSSSTASNALFKIGSGTLTLSGTADNNNLSVTMGSGLLVFNKQSSPSVHAIGLGLSINGGTVQYASSNTTSDQIDPVAVAINGGTLDLNGKSDTVATVSSTGGALLSTSGSGVLTGSGFTKTGAGTTTIGAGATYGGGSVSVNGGTLLLNGATAPASALSVASGATLSGTGSAGAVTVASGGTHAPGNPIGTQSTGNILNGGALSVTFNGTGTYPYNQYSQLNVSGTVNLTGSTLGITSGYTPSAGDTFKIINNDGTDAVTGTFAGLPEGGSVTIGNTVFSVTYKGGDGNDVVLRAAPAPITSGVLISQFRLSGPNGNSDQFIELYNGTARSVNLSGWNLTGGSTTVPLSGTIPSGGHLLVTDAGNGTTGTGYSAVYPSGTGTGVATGDVTYTTDIPQGSTLTLVNPQNVTVNSVSNLMSLAQSTSPTSRYAYVRRLETGTPANTGSDQNDFNLVDTGSTTSFSDQTGVGTLTGARLGAPGPRNTLSPIQRNGLIALSKLNNPQVMNEAKYVSKQGTIDKLGRLSLRRTLTNTSNAGGATGTTFTKLRFRIVAITAGSNTQGAADLRAISSGGVRYYDANNGNAITQAAIGMTLEAPSSPTEAPLTASSSGSGGGQNSSWTVVLPSGGLAPGASLNVEFLFGIASDGPYRVVVDTELLP